MSGSERSMVLYQDVNHMDKNSQIAKEVLEKIGGKDNVISVFHCATRLRFELKDLNKIDETGLKGTDGVLGIKKVGSTFQVIIGPNVGTVYDHLCEISGLSKNTEIDENLEEEPSEQKKMSVKGVFNNIITYIMNSMAPIIPVLIGVSIWKTVGALLGPSMLNVVSETSDFYVMCNFLFTALFYFLPIFVGYTASKQMKVDPVWGMFLGALIIVPNFVALVGTVDSFHIFGIPVPVANYSQQFLPVILGVWILKYVMKFFNKVIPKVISSLIVPILTIGVMTVVMFLVCAPLGSYIGQLFSNIFMYCGNAALPVKIITMMILTALVPIMVLFGMHVAIYVAALTAATAVGYESFFFPCMVVSSFVMYGMSLGAIVKFKKNKSAATGFAISGFVAGITEPSLYGVCLKSKSSIKIMIAACLVGGLFAGLFNLKCSLLASVSLLSLIPFFTVGSVPNLVLGIIVSLGASVLGALGVIFFGKYEEA